MNQLNQLGQFKQAGQIIGNNLGEIIVGKSLGQNIQFGQAVGPNLEQTVQLGQVVRPNLN